MDSNLMSCPTCGHSVSNIAGICNYCGAMMSEEEQQPQSEEKEVVEEAQAAESALPLPQEETPPADVMSDEADDTPSAATEQSDSNLSQQPADPPAVPESSEPATEAVTVSDNEPVALEEEAASKQPDDEQEVESKPEIGQQPPDVKGESEIALIEADEPEFVPDADADPATEVKQDVQEPQVVETAAVGSTAPIAQDEVKTESAPHEIQKPLEPAVVDLAGDEPGESESLGDTILLEIADEVQPSAGGVPDKIEETAKLKAPAEALKIEKAAQKMAAAIEEQKATLTEAQKVKQQKAALTKTQALKKQQAALAKARVLKKQKMILAKAAALKHKKAAQAKAQALKKQKAARAGIETAKKDEIAAIKTATAAGKPKIVRSLEAKTKMQSLLEKYKGQAIGINYDNSAEIREAQLVEANGEFFSVFVKDKKLLYSYPLKTILTVIEGEDGVEAGDSEKKGKFNVVIKVYPLVLF